MSDYLQKMMAKTVFAVEATGFERLTFWQDYHRFIRWEQHGMGCAPHVGEFGGFPVVADLSWVDIAGKTVLFWELVSKVTHIGLWEEWLAKNWVDPKRDNGHRPCTCDSMNFHHCLDAIGALDMLRNNPAWQTEMRRRLS